MNEHFVPVKVDREERPDVDGLYMDAVVALTGHGGWPMTVFLTPDGRPFYGGTYFPPEPRHGMPSFSQVLAGRGARPTQGSRRDLEQQARRARGRDQAGERARALVRAAHERPPERGRAGAAPTPSTRARAASGPRRSSRPPRRSSSSCASMPANGDEEALSMARLTLDRMAAGGMYDLLGGGFHRYSVDAHWLVPHFEKMLYDNALLASAYLHAWVVTGDERYRRGDHGDARLRAAGAAPARRWPRLGAGRGHGRRRGARPSRGRPRRSSRCSAKAHPEWLQPFEHGRFVLRAEMPEDAREQLLTERDTPAAAAARRQGAGRVERARARPRSPRRAPRLGRRRLRRRGASAWPSSCSRCSRTTGRLLRSFRAGKAQIRRLPRGLRKRRERAPRAVLGDRRPSLAGGVAPPGGLMVELFADATRGGFFVDAPEGDGPRRPAQGVRRPPHSRRELDGRLRAPPARADLR